MNQENKIFLTEHSIKRHSKRLLEEIKFYKPDFTLGESQNMFARILGLNTWHEVKKILDSDKSTTTDNPHDFIMSLFETNNEVYCYSDESIFYKDKNKNIFYSKTFLSMQQIKDFLHSSYGSDKAVSKLNGGEDIDYSFQVDDETFSINATKGTKNGQQKIYLSIFKINRKPLPLNTVIMNKNILQHMIKPQGLCIVSGRTGSGKTTLLNSVLNNIGKNPNEMILTYEAPIECYYDDDINVTQTEIGRNLRSFSVGIKNALRRKPSRILIGELRDSDTFDGILEAISTGHCVYTSDYSSSIVAALLYYKNMSKTDYFFKDFLNNLNILINQKIIKSDIGEKTIFLQEFLAFNPSVVKEIIDVIDNPSSLANVVSKLIDANNGSIKNQIKELEKDKLISPELALKLLNNESIKE